MKTIRVGLDCDGVIAAFTEALLRRAKEMGLAEYFPKCEEDVMCWDVSDRFQDVMKDAWTDERFWLGIKPMTKEIPFIPNCYITSRFIPTEVTAKWLAKHKFPKAEVITVKHPTEKVKYAKERNLDLFVDDLYSTVREMRDAGINAILFSQPYQRGHVAECAGLPTITNLQEVFKYV